MACSTLSMRFWRKVLLQSVCQSACRPGPHNCLLHGGWADSLVARSATRPLCPTGPAAGTGGAAAAVQEPRGDRGGRRPTAARRAVFGSRGRTLGSAPGRHAGLRRAARDGAWPSSLSNPHAIPDRGRHCPRIRSLPRRGHKAGSCGFTRNRRRSSEPLRGLAEKGSRSLILFVPLYLYGRLFLRMTLAVRRREELAADALDAEIVGSQPLIDGLQAFSRAKIAFDGYWITQVQPMLDAGFHPPLAEGLARYLSCPSVAKQIDREFDFHHRHTGPYDTHPPLEDRFKALGSLPKRDPAGSQTPAVSLLANLPELEVRLLGRLRNEAWARSLKPVGWSESSLARWEALVRQHAPALA